MDVRAAEPFVAEAAHKDSPGFIVGVDVLDAERHSEDGMDFGVDGVLEVKGEEAADDGELAIDHRVGAGAALIDGEMKIVPPLRVEVVDGFGGIEFGLERGAGSGEAVAVGGSEIPAVVVVAAEGSGGVRLPDDGALRRWRDPSCRAGGPHSQLPSREVGCWVQGG